MLNAALSEEWLAYDQYWIGARLMEGTVRSEVEPELLLQANQEYNIMNKKLAGLQVIQCL